MNALGWLLEQFVWIGPLVLFGLIMAWPPRPRVRHHRWANRRFLRRYRAELHSRRSARD